MLTPKSIPFSFTVLLETASLHVKELMLEALSMNIAANKIPKSIIRLQPIITQTSLVESKPASDSPMDMSALVEHVPDLKLDKALSDGIRVELENLQMKGPASKVHTQWLSPTSDSYNYGKVINKPKPIAQHPSIAELLAVVNSHPSTSGDLDACLVSFFPSNKASLSLHKDDEELISQSSSICTVSFGAPRELEFVLDGKKKNGRKDLSADITLPATDGSMNIMKPGAQSVMKHRVKQGIHNSSVSRARYSISFRKISQKSVEPLTFASPEAKSPVSSHSCSPIKRETLPKKNIVLVAGDSFVQRLDAKLLGKEKHDVQNIARGGSKMSEIQKSLETFSSSNPSLVVKKLFLSFGANDIRYCKDGILHLKNAMCDLMRCSKKLFPEAKIFVQSLIPFHYNGRDYAIGRINLLSMNDLIFSLCSRFKLFYLDVFGAFLDNDGFRNERLFPDYNPVKQHFDIHPNPKGMGVLARFYIYHIHSRWFNPLGY